MSSYPARPPLQDPEAAQPPKKILKEDVPQATTQELNALEVICEQGLIPMDQLSRFLDAPTNIAEKTVDRLCDHGLARRYRPPFTNFDWISSTWKGSGASSCGLYPHRVNSSTLPLIRATNEVRLLLARQAPGGRWFGRRTLLREEGQYARLPRAVFEVGDERHAIEIHLPGKVRAENLGKRLNERARYYDAVICFCADSTRPVLERLKTRYALSNVVIRPIPSFDSDLWPQAGSTGGQRASARSGATGGGHPGVFRLDGLLDTDAAKAVELVAEQVAMPLDQLARFMKRGIPVVEKMTDQLQQEGYLVKKPLLHGDHLWVAPTPAACRITGRRLPRGRHGFELLRLRHMRAVNEVRLHLTERAPEARWICERDLRRLKDWEGQIPDGAIVIGDERHAIEVQLSLMSRRAIEHVVTEHLRRYDAVVYFCSAVVEKRFTWWKLAAADPRLVVRPLPASLGEPPHIRKGRNLERVPITRGRLLSSSEARMVEVIAEQTAVPRDQISRLLRISEAKAAAVIDGLYCDGLIERGLILAEEPEWLWPTYRGVRMTGIGLEAKGVSVGTLPVRRVMNELRIEVEEARPNASWQSRRMLQRGNRRRGPVPAAVIEVDDQRHAVELGTQYQSREALARRYGRLLQEYDALVCVCSPRRLASLEDMRAKRGWDRLVFRRIPGGGSTM